MHATTYSCCCCCCWSFLLAALLCSGPYCTPDQPHPRTASGASSPLKSLTATSVLSDVRLPSDTPLDARLKRPSEVLLKRASARSSKALAIAAGNAVRNVAQSVHAAGYLHGGDHTSAAPADSMQVLKLTEGTGMPQCWSCALTHCIQGTGARPASGQSYQTIYRACKSSQLHSLALLPNWQFHTTSALACTLAFKQSRL